MDVRFADHVDDPSHVDSYYAATTHEPRRRMALEDSISADICIVGAGFTGVSCGLHLAEQGRDVVILDAARVGWGASGRNGGQVINGFSGNIQSISKTLGQTCGVIAEGMFAEGAEIIKSLVDRYRICCDFKKGSLAAACNAKHMRQLEEWQETWRRGGVHDIELLDRNGIRDHVGSDAYCGGLLDWQGGHVHPLNLVLGEARAFERQGGRIFEGSPVVSAEFDAARPVVRTSRAEVTCDWLVLCGNAYLELVRHDFSRRILPALSEISVTTRLPTKLAASLLPTDTAVYDMRFIPDYFRLTADSRMLFGSAARYGKRNGRGTGEVSRRNMVKVFPQLDGIDVEYSWSGRLAVTVNRLPQLGHLGPKVLYGRAYSGHGVNCAHLFGRLLSEAVDGRTERFNVFAHMPQPVFPGGTLLRVPITIAGARWLQLRDRLAV